VADPVRIVFLGGLGEIGRNCACIEVDDRILLLDCGLMFPDVEMLGIDLVLPDFSYLHDNADRVEACVLTHGHEDHIGALSFLLRDLSFPLYGSALTLQLARSRIEEAGLLDRTELIPVADGERRQIGPFDCEFIPVAHSVPHGFATAIRTDQGVILHSGDFKLDLTPVDGRRTDLARMGAIADGEGIRLLLADSTNAEEEGHAPSETSVGRSLVDLFAAQRGRRIICTCFASHLHRVQQIADVALAEGRTIATLGLSMRRNVRVAREMGILRIPDNRLVDIADARDLEPELTCIISTGSQGEPMSALARMAAGDNKWITVGEGDTVILSSHAIPGNEFDVNQVIDGLHRRGAEVIHSGLAHVHATGHAQRDELRILHSVTTPEWFIPVHGEYRHMVHHAALATEMGLPSDRVLVCEDGAVIELDEDGLHKAGSVPAGYLYVDGTVGDVTHGVLRDRRILAQEGVVVIIVAVDAKSGALVVEPEIITRGWIHAEEADELLDEARAAVRQAVDGLAADGVSDHEAIKRKVRRAVGSLVNERTRRRPMIVPVLMET
jgi:ribonuclease J